MAQPSVPLPLTRGPLKVRRTTLRLGNSLNKRCTLADSSNTLSTVASYAYLQVMMLAIWLTPVTPIPLLPTAPTTPDTNVPWPFWSCTLPLLEPSTKFAPYISSMMPAEGTGHGRLGLHRWSSPACLKWRTPGLRLHRPQRTCCTVGHLATQVTSLEPQLQGLIQVHPVSAVVGARAPSRVDRWRKDILEVS